jgi:hypothetical protein
MKVLVFTVLFEAGFVAGDGFGEAEIEGIANKGVAYRHFVEIWHVLLEIAQVLQT